MPWGVVSNPTPGGEYVEWQVAGRSVAGATGMGDNFPPSVPPHWLTYLGTDDGEARDA